MNSDSACRPCCRATMNWLGVIGAFVVMAVLVTALKHYTTVSPISAARAQERYKIASDIRQKTRIELETTGYLDKEKGVVRLPNSVATALAVKQWADPAKARAELLERAAKAFFVPPPPPPAPEKKSDFE